MLYETLIEVMWKKSHQILLKKLARLGAQVCMLYNFTLTLFKVVNGNPYRTLYKDFPAS